MPPKAKYTRQEIAAAALEIIKEDGVAGLTARALGKRLGSSASPVFTVFRNMDEVKWAARELALKEFEAYTADFRDYSPAFKRIGMQMVSYAIHEPELFKLLFMQEYPQRQSFDSAMASLGSMSNTCTELIRRDYAMTEEQARLLFEQMWIYTFGIGALCAMKVCDFTEAEIAERLGLTFAGMAQVLKSDGVPVFSAPPVKEGAEKEKNK
ncbi:MAG: TetR/AcrR family transcriptional regulator [Faecousia sp.]